MRLARMANQVYSIGCSLLQSRDNYAQTCTDMDYDCGQRTVYNYPCECSNSIRHYFCSIYLSRAHNLFHIRHVRDANTAISVRIGTHWLPFPHARYGERVIQQTTKKEHCKYCYMIILFWWLDV